MPPPPPPPLPPPSLPPPPLQPLTGNKDGEADADGAAPDKTLVSALAALLKTAGFNSVRREALVALTGIFHAHSLQLVHRTSEYANAMGRTQPHAADILAALNDSVAIDPFLSFSEMSHFASTTIPLARSLLNTSIPSSAVSHSLLLFSQKEFQAGLEFPPPPANASRSNLSNPKYPLDPHLPPFPSVHTYKKGEISGERETNVARLREIKALRAREVDANLRRLLLAGDSLGGPSSSGASYTEASAVNVGEIVNYVIQRR
ncbi:hypothetical protein BC830DRAFT_1132798 [Chytriomyces sp. MP71]|nr:hypothetical protein BC830DRAFT_1132798 [Chytriomyces sp. MP71]